VAVRYPCPCCGHVVFEDPPGSYEICPVCFWEDDLIQLRWPDCQVGANKLSLVDAQQTFIALGAMQARVLQYVRPARDDEPLEGGWRPIDRAVDHFESWESEARIPWPSDETSLYWWRPTFWNR
jgi:hypothetical protein